MDRIQVALDYHHKGYNCAQAVACAFSDMTGLDEQTVFRMCEGFGFGMGGGKLTCGALSGAVVIASLLSSKGYDPSALSKTHTYLVAKQIGEQFLEKEGDDVCCALKDKGRSCDEFIADAVRILNTVIA
ncbi:MAG: C-GCAxxG-C-C family protein [Sphaerochaetaceae bacterium]